MFDESRSRGQALVECLVACLVLLPLLLAGLWLGKLYSLREATTAASRNLAFECAARPRECRDPLTLPDFAAEVRERFFADQEWAVRSAPRDQASLKTDPLWTDVSGKPFLKSLADIGVRIDPQSFDAPDGLIGSHASGAWEALLETGPSRFGLELREGFVAARVQANLATERWSALGQSLGLKMQGQTAILTDAWTSSGPELGPDSTRSRVERGWQVAPALETVLDAGYAGTRMLLPLAQALTIEPQADLFRYHALSPSVIPVDRRGP